MAGTLLSTRETTATDAGRLLAATAPFHGRGGRELSVKLAHGELLADRFLLSFHKRAFGADALTAIVELAMRLSCPEAFQAELGRFSADADIIHFGYEGSRAGTTYKLYFEFATAFRRDLAKAEARREPVLLHHAFKWDPADQHRRSVSRYFALPGRSRSELERELVALAGGGAGEALGLALLDRALLRASADDLLLMAVEEPGNPRRSFDLNLYPAQLTLDEAKAEIGKALSAFAIPPAGARAALARFGGRTLGHVSAGTGRGGDAFATVYFGAEPIQ